MVNEFIDQIEVSRKKLKELRMLFWEDNKRNFKKNVQKIIALTPPPKDWKVYVSASNFLFDKNIFPFDYDSWSSTNLIAATDKQGYEIMVFLNKARLEFLSLPALVHLISHELIHVEQAAKNPERYLKSIVDDEIAKEGEIEAESRVRNLSDKFREQWVLESVVYCYDFGGWSFAKKMADFFHGELENLYGGGYDKGMTEEEYQAFLKAMKEKEIDVFIEFFNGKKEEVKSEGK